jgi:menaquinone-dependent protoporphyrinogen oxidase
MRVLVVYGSRYVSTRGIAERIAHRLGAAGHQAAAVQAKGLRDIAGYEAFVIGSGVYMGSWLEEPAEFVRRNAAALAAKPVWLFSSGPLGTETTDTQGKDAREAAVPKQIAEFEPLIHPRGHYVFFGALDHKKFGFAHRAVYALPAARKLLIDGDFRDWSDIDAWAADVAAKLAPVREAAAAAR